jgi:hypothetical protein
VCPQGWSNFASAAILIALLAYDVKAAHTLLLTAAPVQHDLRGIGPGTAGAAVDMSSVPRWRRVAATAVGGAGSTAVMYIVIGYLTPSKK